MSVKWTMLFCCIIAWGSRLSAQGIPPIGEWRDHLSYNSTIDLAASSTHIFAGTRAGLFSVDLNDNSIARFSKSGGLSDVGISLIAADPSNGNLLVAYQNSNLDLITGNLVRNIDAIRNKVVNGDKRVFAVCALRSNFYISTGIGIVVIDQVSGNVIDTYIIGSSGQFAAVYSVATDDQFLYAATSEGLRRARISGSNLADFRSWQTVGTDSSTVTRVINANNKILILRRDSLFSVAGNQFNLFYQDGAVINDVRVGAGFISLVELFNGISRIVQLQAGGGVSSIVQKPALFPAPVAALTVGSDLWVADSIRGLTRLSNNNVTAFIPSGPSGRTAGKLVADGDGLWVASGSVHDSFTGNGVRDGFYLFRQEEWTNYNSASVPALDSFPDVLAVVQDPLTKTTYAGSFGGGLLQLDADKKVTVYKKGSILGPSLADPTRYQVSDLLFGNDKNLWVADYGAARELLVKRPDNNWYQFFFPFNVPGNTIGQLLQDDFNQLWMVLPGGGGVACFNYGNGVDNTADDKWIRYRAGAGNGNLPSDDVRCVAKDRNGFIWVGTTKGIGIIQCPQEIFSSSGCPAIQPVVQQDNFAGYLFQDEIVQAIATDGANRKWVGTKNGVWLISAGGEKIVYRFTSTNSPLPGNDVRHIAIDSSTGEVFFGTAAGLTSFRGTATVGSALNESVLVFPNPVSPSYTGTIAIRGLAENSIVKITEMDGRLVYQTRALGGQAVWDGHNYQGRKVSTGVYLVLVSDEQRREHIATKIVFIKGR